MRMSSPEIPKKYRKRIMREHYGLRIESIKKHWWSPRYLQPLCSCGWKGEKVHAMPAELVVTSEDLAIMQMDQHVREILAGYKAGR